MKECIKCKKIKELVEFPIRKDSPDGRRNTCILCRKEYHDKWRSGETEVRDFAAPDGMKVCRKCNRILEIKNFGKSKQNKDGLKSYCKDCKKEESSAWRENNIGYVKEYREKNKDKLVEYNKQYYEENKKELNKRRVEYAEQNWDSESGRKKEWYEKNKERIIKSKLNRRQTNIHLRLSENLRSRLYQAIKGDYKLGSAVKDLGCSMQDFKKYLERLFEHGMCWGNYGKWHIDHIVPLSSFDLTDRDQVKKACHYTNLQPLWAEDNLRKGARLPE